MNIDIAASLNQRQRDALLSYYLGQYVPASSNPDLVSLVQTPEDVYEYLLIDPLVSNAVPTSRVVQAMASIQQYINGITMNMEPGYTTQSLDQENISNWKDGLSQYDIWAGEVELDTYPENYIDPTLRQSQTTYFKELITDLNQNTINSDTAQQAVMNYLNKFEQVANLTIVSGYLDGTDQTSGLYYFLGKSIGSPEQYYWRSFDMSQNIDNVMSTSAWSEWFPMNTGINEDALQGIPRLVYFNNRLYLFWFEKVKVSKNIDSTVSEDFFSIKACSSYCDFSGNWSATYIVSEINQLTLSETDKSYYSALFSADSSKLSTCCLYNSDSNSLTLSLYCKGTDVYSDFSLAIDYWFKSKTTQASTDGDATIQGLNSILNTYLDYQKKVQCTYLNDQVNYTTKSVTLRSDSHNNDFSGAQLATLTSNNFTISNNATTVTVECTIPLTVNTSNYDTTHTESAWLYYPSGDTMGLLHFTYSGQKVSVFTGIQITDVSENAGVIDHYKIDSDGQPGEWALVNASPVAGGTIFIDDNLTCSPASTNVVFNFQNATSMVMSSESYALNTDQWVFEVYSDSWKGTNEVVQQKSPANSGNVTFSMSFPVSTQDIPFSLFFGYIQNNDKDISEGYDVIISPPAVYVPVTPSITTYSGTTGISDYPYGIAVYLQFSDLAISNIRLNTLFAKELINKANVSMQALLNWDTQLTLEPPMSTDGSGATTPMDFSGANGLYFWELFFYMPYLVAWRLAQEQQYSDALDWYHYIFDPAARGRDNSSDIRKQYPEPDYWSVRPLVEVPSPSAQASAVWLTTDPDALASASPVHYQKAVFMAYVGTLMAAADASYRLLTNDGLSLARLQYGQVRDLLGPRPDSVIINHWVPESLEALAAGAGNSAALTGFEQQAPALPAFPGQASAADEATTSDVFMAPVNTQLLTYWNNLDARLYNLHHWLTLDGQPLNIPLYAPPVNPTLLMEQSVQGGSLISTVAGVVVTVPPYRFSTMLQSARAAVSTLSQFGQTLLSYGERQDAAGLQELDAQQLFTLSGYSLQLQQNAIDAIDKDRTSLEKSRDMAQQRQDHYQALYNQNLFSGETAAMALQDASSASLTAASPFITAGMAMRTIPNIFGLADGGQDIGAPTIAAGMVLQLTGEIQGIAARQTEVSENYKRRREEWQIQYQQAQSEVEVVNTQLDALTVRRTGAVTALNLATQQQTYLKTTLNFLTTRFTQSALYNWLTGQLSALYYQAYDATLSLCLSAEACWQYEMGDISTRFIQTDTWNDNYRGLLVGETLQLNLQQMESAWLNRYSRRLEITKTVSLKSLLALTDWDNLQSSGAATFSLKESLFDGDYPGHYLRQIKSVTVSLPALVGPYQDVRMTLTQSGSRVLLKPDINGVNYLNNPTTGSATSILTNPRASQQVAVSSGLNDAGLFVLNFGDERYLPFEGTGAVSDWQIAFPNLASAEQKALLASLNDVIVQVHYTAIYGGSSFELAVTGTLQPLGSFL